MHGKIIPASRKRQKRRSSFSLEFSVWTLISPTWHWPSHRLDLELCPHDEGDVPGLQLERREDVDGGGRRGRGAAGEGGRGHHGRLAKLGALHREEELAAGGVLGGHSDVGSGGLNLNLQEPGKHLKNIEIEELFVGDQYAY